MIRDAARRYGSYSYKTEDACLPGRLGGTDMSFLLTRAVGSVATSRRRFTRGACAGTERTRMCWRGERTPRAKGSRPAGLASRPYSQSGRRSDRNTDGQQPKRQTGTQRGGQTDRTSDREIGSRRTEQATDNRDRQRDRETDRQTGRQRDSQTARRDRETGRRTTKTSRTL